MTGTGVVGAGSGVHTFRDRQFSSLVFAYAMVDGSICGQMGPRAVASRVVVQAAAGWGGFQRLSPPVVAAKGMPRNDRTPPAVAPWTMPSSVGTSRPLVIATSEEPASTMGFEGADDFELHAQRPRSAVVTARNRRRAFIGGVVSLRDSADGTEFLQNGPIV